MEKFVIDAKKPWTPPLNTKEIMDCIIAAKLVTISTKKASNRYDVSNYTLSNFAKSCIVHYLGMGTVPISDTEGRDH
jgi:hypothetical protein